MTVPARYYHLDFRKLTLGECWRLRGSLSGFWNLFHLKAGMADPPVVTECVPDVWPAIPGSELSAAARQAMVPALRDLRDAGYEVTHYGADRMLEPGRFRFKVILLSDDRRTGGLLDSLHQFGNVFVNLGLTSRLSDGSYRITSSNRDAFRRYPNGHWVGCPGRSAGEIAARHLDNLDPWIRRSGMDPSPYWATRGGGHLHEPGQGVGGGPGRARSVRRVGGRRT